jgi:UDP-GlcNAc:undecaprenyl-phosphate GlcNAc-1-phosphate transferase
MISLCLEIVASLIVVGAGVRFSILSVGTGAELPLGEWAVPLTVLWLVGATNVVKLLDGLEGAVSVLLLVGAVAVAYTTIGVPEHFLNAFSIAMIGATLASLRFNAYPARLSLRGPGSAFAGFLFAVLTVLARQKTVAALLLVFPLLLIVIIVGGAMLSFLERTVLIGDNDKE